MGIMNILGPSNIRDRNNILIKKQNNFIKRVTLGISSINQGIKIM